MTSESFAPSARAKLARAAEHNTELHRLVEEFRDKDAYAFTITQRDDPFDHAIVRAEYKVRVRKEPPADQWAVVLGDLLTNLRAVLDHAIYAHVVARKSITADQAQAVKFPVCDTAQKWRSWAGTQLATQWISSEFRDAIESVQPVSATGSAPQDTTLYALNELVNIDKHRTCHVVNYSGTATFDKVNKPLSRSFMDAGKGRPLVHGAILKTERVVRPLAGSKYTSPKYDFDAEVGYTEVVVIPGRRGLAMLGLCDLMIARVTEVLDLLAEADSLGSSPVTS